MKKLFTLAICLLSLSAVFAQYGHDGYDRRPGATVIIGNGGYDRDGAFDRGYDRQGDLHRIIERINCKYDAKVADVQNDRYLRFWERNRIIRNLEFQRRDEIRNVYARFGGRGFDRDNEWRH